MENKKIRGVIFDQDGLLFDTERISVEAWNLAGDELGFHLEESFLCTIRGANAQDSAIRFRERFGDAFDFLKLRKRKQEHFMRILREREMPVKLGARELLIYLQEQEYKVALATASTREYSMENLERAGLTEFFSLMITGDMVQQAKPNPEIFLKAAEKMGEEPGHCLVLEDSLNGVEAGIQGGFVTIMVPDLTQPDQKLRSRVERVCDSLLEVRDWLMEG
ncbi:MAG: HAD family phosphatase [Lachnospiraceae bacterium]|nr:HAD family phosphatase [Lachnospiraceae bacterium]